MEVERDLDLQKNELLLFASSLDRQIKSKRTEAGRVNKIAQNF